MNVKDKIIYIYDAAYTGVVTAVNEVLGTVDILWKDGTTTTGLNAHCVRPLEEETTAPAATPARTRNRLGC